MTDRVRLVRLARLGAASSALCLVLVLGASPAATLGAVPQGSPTTEDPIGGGIGDRPGADPTEPESTTTSGPAPTGTEAPTSAPGDEADTESPDPGQPITTQAEPTDDGEGGLGAAGVVVVALLAFGVGLLVAGVPLLTALSRRRANAAAPGAGPLPPPPPVAVAATPPSPAPPAAAPQIGAAPSRAEVALRTQRSELVAALIALRDQLPSTALVDEAGRALAAAGVVEVRPDGEAFDPAQHRAVDRVAVTDPAQHDRVVSTERPGYRDGTGLVRQPEVVVGRFGEQA